MTNHTGHDHPATPAGRAACRKAMATDPFRVGAHVMVSMSDAPVQAGVIAWADEYRATVTLAASGRAVPVLKSALTPMTAREAARNARNNRNRSDAAAGRLARIVKPATPRKPAVLMVDHCELCGASDYESVNCGDQGYSACCNEPIISRCTDDCDHTS